MHYDNLSAARPLHDAKICIADYNRGLTASRRKLCVASSKAFISSSSDSPRLMLTFLSVGSIWLTLTRLLLTPLSCLGPVIKTKFLSTMSTTIHFLPDSRPKSFTQTLPTSIAGIASHLPELLCFLSLITERIYNLIDSASALGAQPQNKEHQRPHQPRGTHCLE